MRFGSASASVTSGVDEGTEWTRGRSVRVRGEGGQRRPGGRSARVRERVLEATVELVARRGVAGVRYEEVAELAGVHKTSVYRNWPDRDTLVREAVLHVTRDRTPIGSTGDFRRDAVDYLTTFSEGLTTPLGQALLTALRTSSDSPATREVMQAMFAQRAARFQRRIEEGIAAGQLPSVDSYFLSELLSGPVHLYATRGLRQFTHAEAEKVVDVVLAGLRALNSAGSAAP
jgi:AcrR family transcriptional regulator